VTNKYALGRLAWVIIGLIIIIAIGIGIYITYKPTATTTPSTSPVSSTSSPPSTNVTITFAGWVSSGAEYEFDVQMVNEFNQLHPGIHVVFTPITSNYYSTLATRLATGTGPSVFYMENTELPRFAAAGYLANLSALANYPSYNLSDFIPNMLKTFYYKGTLYAVPKDWGVLGVYYNKKLLQMAGLPDPPANWNWTTFMYYLKTLKQKLPPGYYPMTVTPSWARILAFVHEAGGDWVNQAGTGTPTNTTPIYEGLAFWYNLYNKGYAVLASNLSAGWNGGDFALGKVAMVVSGTWTIPVLESNSSQVPAGEWGVQWLPSDEQRGTMMFVVGLAVNSHLSPAQMKAAIEFVEWFTSENGEYMWVMKGLALPARLSILHNSTYISANPAAAYLAEQFPYAYGWAYNTTNWDALHTDVHNVVANLFSGTITLNQAYKEIVNDTNLCLSGQCPTTG